ncbi:MAG: acyl-CoA thioesterase [Pacificimonas sp.]
MSEEQPPRFSVEVTAAARDIDELGHVNNAVYVGWIQKVATAHWYATAPEGVADRNIWVVIRHEIDYRAPTLEGETVTLSTWVGAAKGARFDRHVEIHGTDGMLRVKAHSWWAMLDRQTMRPLRIGSDIIEHFSHGDTSASTDA